MKIFLVLEGYIPSQEAASFSVMKLAQGFKQLDMTNDVTVISLLSLPIIRNLIKYRNIFEHYAIRNDIKLKFIPVWNKDFFTKSASAKNLSYNIHKYIVTNKPDLLYARDSIVSLLSIKSCIPTVVETHSTVSKIFNSNELRSFYDDPHFVSLITIHDIIKNRFIDHGFPSEKIQVLEDGVDINNFNIEDDKSIWRIKLGLPTDKTIVMYLGNLYIEKGIEDILRTAKQLETNDDIKFILAGGKDKDVQYWKSYCLNNKIKNVEFIGFVKNKIVPHYLKASDILLMPYNTNVVYKKMDIHTTSPLKLFEYMASLRPIISTNLQTISKIIQHNHSAYLSNPNNIFDIAKHILRLKDNSLEANRLARNAYHDVQKFEWSKRCSQIISKFQTSS